MRRMNNMLLCATVAGSVLRVIDGSDGPDGPEGP